MKAVQDQLEEIRYENGKLQAQIKDGNSATDVIEQKDKEIRNLNSKVSCIKCHRNMQNYDKIELESAKGGLLSPQY